MNDHEQSLSRLEAQHIGLCGRVLLACLLLAGALLAMAESGVRRLWQWLTIRRVCAWCRRRTGGSPWPIRHTTHGICRECRDQVTAKFLIH